MRLYPILLRCSLRTGERVAGAGHVPVMCQEVLSALQLERGNSIIDMTFGAGGHSRAILQSVPDVKIYALDRDPLALTYANRLREEFPDQVVSMRGRFSDLPQLLKKFNVKQNSIHGILFDFGCSSMQFDIKERGFSLSQNGPLDMRMEPDTDITAADVMYNAEEEDLYKIIKCYGEEKNARKIARAIVETRYMLKRLDSTFELADLVESVTSEGDCRVDKLQRRSHAATKTFQAFRIFVNNELNEINYGILLAQHYLKLGGRLVTLTFHSLEDTIVKRHLIGNVIENSAGPVPLKFNSHTFTVDKEVLETIFESNWKSLYKHVLVPRYEEMENNPRSRSAKMRAAIRIK